MNTSLKLDETFSNYGKRSVIRLDAVKLFTATLDRSQYNETTELGGPVIKPVL